MEIISIHKIRPNIGQIEGLPANPRTIDAKKFEKLKQSIQDYPEMLGYRSLMLYPIDNGFYVIVGGNMRYKACVELGMTELPCVVIDKKTPVEKLRAFTILDNNEFGEWDMEMLSAEWNVDELGNWGIDLLGEGNDYEPIEISDETPMEGNTNEQREKTITCPFCGKNIVI